MAISPIPESHRLVRHVKKRSLATDPENPTVVIGILGDAFRLRPDEDSLSASWAEFFATEPDQVRAAIEHFKTVYSVKKADRFAVGQVGEIKQACAEFGVAVRIVSEPMPKYDSHAAVRRYRDDNLELLEVLASEAWAQIATP